MAKSGYEKAKEFAERMTKDPLLVALRNAENAIRSKVQELFKGLANEEDVLLFSDEEQFDANNGDVVIGLCLEDGQIQVMTELEDGEPWNMDLPDLKTENLVDLYHLLLERQNAS